MNGKKTENNEQTTNNEQEQKTDESTGAGEQQGVTNWREEPGAKAMVKQIGDLRAELDSKKAADTAAAEKAEQERLEKAGEWDKLAADKDAKIKAAEERAKAIERKYELTNKLSGINSEEMREWAIFKAPADGDIDGYVEGLKKDRPHLFEPAGTQPAEKPAPGEKSDHGSKMDAATSRKMRESGTTEERAKARKYEEEYFSQHGEWPS